MQPKHLSADERRSLTVNTVVTLAGQQNPSEITTAAIAGKMQVTQGALFRHFTGKDAIWKAVMDWTADGLLARVDRAGDTAASPTEALQAMFMTNVEFIIEYPGVPRLMLGELQHQKLTPAKKAASTLMQRYAERIKFRVEAGKSLGLIAADVDPHLAAVIYIGAVQGLVIQSLLSGDVTAMRMTAPSVFDIYLRGIRSAQGGSK